MNLFQLVIKQMRQRALSTWLTLLSVLLGVGLATAILIFQREGAKLFGQSDFGYDLLVGPKGSKLQVVLNTTYHLSSSPGLIPYSYYEDFPQLDRLEWAVPYAVGDEYQGHRIVGTLPKLFRGFPQPCEQLSRLAQLQRQLNGDAIASAADRSRRQREIRDDLAKVHQQLETDAPDAAARIHEAIESIDRAAQPRANSKEDQDRALSAIVAANVLATGPAQYRRGRSFELAEGKLFHPRKFEAIVGWDVARKGGLPLGAKFKAEHGAGGAGLQKEQHEEQWTVVGVLKPTHTANDRVIFIPLVTFYAISGHEKALIDIAGVRGTAPQHHDHEPSSRPAFTQPSARHDDHDHEHEHTVNPDGTINLNIPKSEWTLAAFAARSSGAQGAKVEWFVNNGTVAMAVNPAQEMGAFFKTFLEGSGNLLLLIATLVTIVAAVSILVSIYNSVSARRKEIAIMRALGATRSKVLTLICVEAALIGLLGGLAGLLIGHLLGASGSIYMNMLMGEGIDWMIVDQWELVYVAGVVALAVLAGLVPASKAYHTSVASNLVAA